MDIDLVYTWCDSCDPRWLERKAMHWLRDAAASNAFANSSGRFNDFDELRFSLRSVFAYAPFVRDIYIVSDGQRPKWLRPHARIKHIDHADLMPATARPVFSSMAIESYLHRIAGLSKNFLYANDDMMFAGPCSADDFLTPAGTVRVRLESSFICRPPCDDTDAYFFALFNTARLLADGLSSRFNPLVAVPDAARGLIRAGVWTSLHPPGHQIDLLSSFSGLYVETAFASVLAQLRSKRFRSNSDVLPLMLWSYHALASGAAVAQPVERDCAFITMVGDERRYDALADHLLTYVGSGHIKLMCFNTPHGEVQEAWGRFLMAILPRLFPNPAPWEIGDPVKAS